MRLNEVQKQNISDLLATLPSSLRNNERSYWRKKLERFYETGNQSIARELEDRFEGLSIDIKITDSGVLPESK